ncbi:MAG: HutP family protein [Phascolarctobacterium sp.]|nr:HutP family protein [Phascolarctobacterium sp.]
MATANNLMESSIKSEGAAAMLLALTNTIYDEDKIKEIIVKNGYKVVVTGVGGKASMDDFNKKVNRAVVGACLNSGVIQKFTNEIHALLHATEEAKKGVFVSVSMSANLAFKIAVMRGDKWIAVALFGKSALHYMTNPDRAGLGTMHI